eukprot:COSAG01_NODE_4090_length_5360_cov_26.230184_3_plen_360_part_00
MRTWAHTNATDAVSADEKLADAVHASAVAILYKRTLQASMPQDSAARGFLQMLGHVPDAVFAGCAKQYLGKASMVLGATAIAAKQRKRLQSLLKCTAWRCSGPDIAAAAELIEDKRHRHHKATGAVRYKGVKNEDGTWKKKPARIRRFHTANYDDFCNIPMVAQHLRLDGTVTHPLSGVRCLAFVTIWLNDRAEGMEIARRKLTNPAFGFNRGEAGATGTDASRARVAHLWKPAAVALQITNVRAAKNKKRGLSPVSAQDAASDFPSLEGTETFIREARLTWKDVDPDRTGRYRDSVGRLRIFAPGDNCFRNVCPGRNCTRCAWKDPITGKTVKCPDFGHCPSYPDCKLKKKYMKKKPR